MEESMTPLVRAFARKALWMLPVWAAMLFLGTLTHQPDPQTDFASFSLYVTTNQFLISHLLNSIFGAAVGSIGVVGLMLYLQDNRAFPKAVTGMVATLVSNTLNTSIFGIAAFTQPALGRAFLAGQQNTLELYNMIYAAPLFGTAIVAILMLLIGGIFTGIAVAASGRFPRWAGWLYAVTVAAFALSVFFFSSAQSVITALLFVATVAVAWSAAREGQKQVVSADVSPEL
jgi:hypothetical protein